MRIALYIDNDVEQIVLTPEGDTETAILNKLHDGTRSLKVMRGVFYECRGGWMREGPVETSTILVLRSDQD